MEGQRLRLLAELETRGVRRPVNWACEQTLDSGGLVFELKSFNSEGWRKGI